METITSQFKLKGVLEIYRWNVIVTSCYLTEVRNGNLNMKQNYNNHTIRNYVYCLPFFSFSASDPRSWDGDDSLTQDIRLKGLDPEWDPTAVDISEIKMYIRIVSCSMHYYGFIMILWILFTFEKNWSHLIPHNNWLF